MNTILIVSANQADFNMFNTCYGYLPVHYSWARNPDEALKYIDIENPTHIFLVSDKIEVIMDWIEMLRTNSVRTPFVCFTKKLEWTARDMLWKSNALDIFEFPANRKELGYILRAYTLGGQEQARPMADHIRGNLSDFNVIDLIHTFEKSENSGTLVLENGAKRGTIEFEKGQICNAEFRDVDPLEAVIIFSTWDEGVFHAKFDKQKRRRKIMLENEQVVLECRNYQDEQKELLQKLPDNDVKLYTAPDLEYEEFGPKDRQWFQKFKNGLSLAELSQEYAGNQNFMLKKILLWLEHNWLMDEATFRGKQERIQAEQKKSVFKKWTSRVFHTSKKKKQVEQEMPSNEMETEDFLEQSVKKPYLFTDFQLIHSFQTSMEEAE